jgi:hypothetical protein
MSRADLPAPATSCLIGLGNEPHYRRMTIIVDGKSGVIGPDGILKDVMLPAELE